MHDACYEMHSSHSPRRRSEISGGILVGQLPVSILFWASKCINSKSWATWGTVPENKLFANSTRVNKSVINKSNLHPKAKRRYNSFKFVKSYVTFAEYLTYNFKVGALGQTARYCAGHKVVILTNQRITAVRAKSNSKPSSQVTQCQY